MDRKYKQRGYSDRDAQEKKRERSERPPSRGRSRIPWARALRAWLAR
jgi:hypothetical protein